MTMRSSARLVAGAAMVALVATACNGEAADQPGQEDPGGTLRIFSTEPAYLMPTAANDQPSILVLRQLYSGLVDFDEDGEPVNDIAESIDSDDNITWTITLRDDFTFHNGEPVDAESFIRSWNFTADGDNAQENAYFMSRIVGFEESQEGAEELAGLEQIDEHTFTVELNEPFVGFPAALGYSGFFPMAQECLDDVEACNETPIGNGPYQIDGSWERNLGITLTRYDDYPDEGKSYPDTLDYRIFADVEAGYAAFQAGELDVMYVIPPARYAEIQQTQGERIFEEPGHSFTFLALPLELAEFEDERVRQALSLAIDRQAIVDAILEGQETPADGVVSPQFEGYRPDVCEFCQYDPERAQELLEEAGGWQWGELELWANAGAGHDEWLQAVGDQLRENLGIEYQLEISLDFPEYLARADAQEFTGPFRLGWGPDYPLLETYLQPLYGTGADSNFSGFSDEQFDDLVAQGDAAEEADEAIPYYQQAEDIIVEQLPVIPMFFATWVAIWGETVEEFVWNPFNEPEYGQMVVNQD